MSRNTSVRQQAVEAMLELWPNSPLARDEAEKILDALENAGIVLLRRVRVESIEGLVDLGRDHDA